MRRCFGCNNYKSMLCSCFCDAPFNDYYEAAPVGSKMHFMKKWAEQIEQATGSEPTIEEFDSMLSIIKEVN